MWGWIKKMWKWIKKYWKDIVCCIVILLFILTNISHCTNPKVVTETVVETDTIVKVEYKEIEVPKEKIKYVDRIKLDTLYLHDTIFVKEQIHYSDSIANIWVSGYKPEIDSIHYTIPEKTVYVDKIITETITPKESFWKNRFIISAGISAQYGLIHQQFDVGPYIGVGIRLY